MVAENLTSADMERNRNALRHIPAWLKHRGYTQRQLAVELDRSDASVSRWLRGTLPMTVADFARVAAVLGTRPEALLFPPDAGALPGQYRAAAELVGRMTSQQLEAWLTVGAVMTNKETATADVVRGETHPIVHGAHIPGSGGNGF